MPYSNLSFIKTCCGELELVLLLHGFKDQLQQLIFIINITHYFTI